MLSSLGISLSASITCGCRGTLAAGGWCPLLLAHVKLNDGACGCWSAIAWRLWLLVGAARGWRSTSLGAAGGWRGTWIIKEVTATMRIGLALSQ